MIYLYNFYKNLFFINKELTTMDSELMKFRNLRTLKLNNNNIEVISNVP